MGINNNKNGTQLSSSQILELFFDSADYTELFPMAGSSDSDAEAMAACGKVGGESVYAFAQSIDRFDGAMSVAQANKLLKVYELALKTGYPVVGFYTGKGGRVCEGNMLLDALGQLLCSSGKLSGVVPQISVVLNDCLATNALLASNADFIIKCEDTQLSLKESCCKSNRKTTLIADSDKDAIEKAKELLSYLPSNNLSVSPVCDGYDAGAGDSFIGAFDADSALRLYEKIEDVEMYFARLMGETVGVIRTNGATISSKSAKTAASFVRFCDAFALSVVTAVDTEGFECIGGAKAMLSAYAEATCPKISVVTGTAVGTAYMVLAGKGSGADAVLATENAVISPVAPRAAAYIALGDKLTGDVKAQDAQLDEYVATELSAKNAAKNGFVDDITDCQGLRNKLANYLDMLSAKREVSLPKKHATV